MKVFFTRDNICPYIMVKCKYQLGDRFPKEDFMSYYEYLNEKSALCKEKADLLHDEGLVQFYENASQGFKQRANRLTLKEAEGTKEDFEEEQKRQQEGLSFLTV